MDTNSHKKDADTKELLILAAVTSKLEEGNIRAATIILCSRDFPVPIEPSSNKYPADTCADNLRDLRGPLMVDPYQMTEKDVADAVCSFQLGHRGSICLTF